MRVHYGRSNRPPNNFALGVLGLAMEMGFGYGVIFSKTDDFSFSIEIRQDGLSRFGAKRLHTETGTMGGDSYSIR
jgi:hypothetical protein